MNQLCLRAKAKQAAVWWTAVLAIATGMLVSPGHGWGQGSGSVWGGFAGDPHHTATSTVASQALNRIRWSTPVDLDPRYRGSNLLIHYGSPLVTTSNTVIVPVKTGATGGFRVEARSGTDGSLLWKQASNYLLPPHNWT